MNDVWKQLYQVVQDRKASPQEGSYTCYLFDKGLDKILKKVERNVQRPSSPPRMGGRRRRWGRSQT